MSRTSLLFLPLVIGLLVGCSGKAMLPVEGTVTLDGEPLEGAAVSFVPVEGGRPAAGHTDAEGRFTLASFTANDGLPPGEYKVTVVKLDVRNQARAAEVEEGENDEALMGNAEEVVRYITPMEASSPATTQLRAEVKPGMSPVEINLKSDR